MLPEASLIELVEALGRTGVEAKRIAVGTGYEKAAKGGVRSGRGTRGPREDIAARSGLHNVDQILLGEWNGGAKEKPQGVLVPVYFHVECNVLENPRGRKPTADCEG